jgi:5-methylcytosine-specific restriction endonuclease McrA
MLAVREGQVLSAEAVARIGLHLARILLHTQHAQQRANLRRAVFAAYGGRCQCCGLNDPNELTLDHITPRRGKKRGDPYRQAIAQGFPRDRFQVLCRKCNSRKGTGAACPCQQKRIVPLRRRTEQSAT